MLTAIPGMQCKSEMLYAVAICKRTGRKYDAVAIGSCHMCLRYAVAILGNCNMKLRYYFLINAPGQVLFDQEGLGREKAGKTGSEGVPWFGGSNVGPPLAHWGSPRAIPSGHAGGPCDMLAIAICCMRLRYAVIKIAIHCIQNCDTLHVMAICCIPLRYAVCIAIRCMRNCDTLYVMAICCM
jgi:hypothetical protein